MVEHKAESRKVGERIFVIAGKDESIVGVECGRLLECLLGQGEKSTGLLKVDGSEVSAADVLDELRTAPFLTNKRVVVMKRADGFISKHRELLERYFEEPCTTGVLVLCVSTWPSRTKLAKKLTLVGRLIVAEQPKSWQLPDRLVKYAKEAHNKTLNKSTAELLIELVGDEQVRLYSEVDKLALFVGDAKNIGESDIEQLVGHNRIFGAFAVIDAIVAGDIERALVRMRKMFAEDRAAEYTIVGAFAYHLRRVFEAKVLLGRGMQSTDVARRLRIFGSRDKFFAQLRKMTLGQISATLQRLGQIDYAIKTGRTKATVAMEQLVLSLSSI